MFERNGKSISDATVSAPARPLTLEDGRLERVAAWGEASYGMGWVFRPTAAEAVADIFDLARRSGVTVAFRGGGNSYGDAAYNEGGIVLDLTRMNRILAWDPATGVISAEPGVTLRQLWEYCLADGWWPPVSTGTARVTLGGMAAMNVHGKNAYKLGPIGDNLLSFELMLPSGEVIVCSREENSDVFHAAIGGAGLLGCFISLTLQMKRIYSGYLDVGEYVSRSLSEMFAQFRTYLPQSDYLVGWVDGTSSGNALGRGQIHQGNYLAPGDDPFPEQSLRLETQQIPDTIMGLLPKSSMWLFMRPFFNNVGVRLINLAKYSSSVLGDGSHHRWTHPQFHFLLDYVPNWKKAYGDGGLIQYQPFVPDDAAESVFTEILKLTQKQGWPTYLGVLKRHKPDPFWLTHGLDGWSLALDFRITQSNRADIERMLDGLDKLVLSAGGRFYFAKDSTLRPDTVRAYLGDKTIKRFRRLKDRCDPDGLIETNLYRRLLAE